MYFPLKKKKDVSPYWINRAELFFFLSFTCEYPKIKVSRIVQYKNVKDCLHFSIYVTVALILFFHCSKNVWSGSNIVLAQSIIFLSRYCIITGVWLIIGEIIEKTLNSGKMVLCPWFCVLQQLVKFLGNSWFLRFLESYSGICEKS